MGGRFCLKWGLLRFEFSASLVVHKMPPLACIPKLWVMPDWFRKSAPYAGESDSLGEEDQEVLAETIWLACLTMVAGLQGRS